MFKFRFFSLVIISMMLILGLSAGSVLAKTGSVKVDSDNLCDPDREDHTITTNTLYIWLNLSNKNASNPGTVCARFVNHDTGDEVDIQVTFEPVCVSGNPRFFLATVDISALADGSITMIVYDDNTCDGNSIGGDTFELSS